MSANDRESSSLRIGTSPIDIETNGIGKETEIGCCTRGSSEIDIYNAKLGRVKLGALIATALHSVNGFLGYCALTWATVIILGGFVPDLTRLDFYSVSVLLVLEAVRLAAAALFGNLFTRKLVNGSSDPRRIKYNDFQRQILVEVLRVVDQVCQLGVVATSFVVSLRRLQELSGHFEGTSFNGLHDSLQIFYTLVLTNAIIATVAVAHAKTITLIYVTSYDLRRFYDKVVWNGMEKGLLGAQENDFVSFTISTQADEYRRNLRAPVVYTLYKDLIDHLYLHDKGFEAVYFALDSGDIYEKEAAANIVGLWAKSEYEKTVRNPRDVSKKPLLCLQTSLLSKLAGAMKDDKTGRAATSSFVFLAKIDPKGMLEVKSESGEQLVNILINSIRRVVRVGRHNRALVYMKVLIQLFEDGTCYQQMKDDAQRNSLIHDLTEVFKKGSLKRTKAIAGCALQLITVNEQPTKELVTTYLRTPQPKPGEHILQEEKEELVKLLQLIDEGDWPEDWGDAIEVRDPKCPGVSPFFARPVTSFILSVITLLLVAFGSYLLFRYASF